MRGIKKGFTLIELMVVIAIMAILVVVAIPSYNSYNNDQKLNEAVSQLQTILRQAQNNAQTGTGCKDGSNVYKSSKWTITLNTNSYTVSSGCDFSTIPTTTPTPTPGSQQASLPSGVTISMVRLVNLPSFTTISACVANPPDPSTAIVYKNLSSEIEFNVGGAGCPYGVSNPNVAAVITLSSNTSSTNTQDIVVEKGGPIYVGSAVPTPCPLGVQCMGGVGASPSPSPTPATCINFNNLCVVGSGLPCCSPYACLPFGPTTICR